MKILMVCLGNICRSPLAEGVMREKLKKYRLFGEVDSCGTGGWHVDQAPDNRMQETAKQHNIDISKHKGRKFSCKDFNDFDVIYVMDDENFRDVTSLASTEEERRKVRMLLNELYPGENRSVPDPYYDQQSGFEKVWQLVDAACEAITQNLRNNGDNSF